MVVRNETAQLVVGRLTIANILTTEGHPWMIETQPTPPDDPLSPQTLPVLISTWIAHSSHLSMSSEPIAMGYGKVMDDRYQG